MVSSTQKEEFSSLSSPQIPFSVQNTNHIIIDKEEVLLVGELRKKPTTVPPLSSTNPSTPHHRTYHFPYHGPPVSEKKKNIVWPRWDVLNVATVGEIHAQVFVHLS
jgi:uncharacterized protein YifN (PemK superfamily)